MARSIGYAFADYMLLYPAWGYTTTAVNLRSGAGTNYSVLLVVPSGGSLTILSGPTSNGWYNVQYGTVAGYMIGTYIAFQDNNVSFVPGETPYTTTSLRLRTGAGTGYGTIAVLPTGTTCDDHLGTDLRQHLRVVPRFVPIRHRLGRRRLPAVTPHPQPKPVRTRAPVPALSFCVPHCRRAHVAAGSNVIQGR